MAAAAADRGATAKHAIACRSATELKKGPAPEETGPAHMRPQAGRHQTGGLLLFLRDENDGGLRPSKGLPEPMLCFIVFSHHGDSSAGVEVA